MPSISRTVSISLVGLIALCGAALAELEKPDGGNVPTAGGSAVVNAPPGDFYLVQDAKTARCAVTDKKPIDSATAVVGTYKTNAQARGAMMAMSLCKMD